MNAALLVMRKELKEFFRDKRVRTNAVVMPAVVMLLMLSFMGFISGIGEKENQVIHVVKTDNKLIERLKADKVKIVDVANEEEGVKLIKSGKARLVLEFEPDFDAKVAQGKPTPIQAFYDPQQDTGKMALRAAQDDLEKLDEDQALAVLNAHHIDKDALAPARIVNREIRVGKTGVSDFLISMLPYLVVLYAFYGGLGPASETVAGEKEKQTLETLLITPVDRNQIALGKFFALTAICFCSSLSALMGIVIASLSRAPIYAKLFPNGLGLSGIQIGTMVLVLIPAVAFFGSLLLAISAFAKNTREAQSSMGLVSLVVLIPALFGNVIGLTDLGANWWVRLVPVLNTSMTLRESLQGKSDGLGIVLTIATGVVLAAIGIRIAVHLFRREEVLTRV
ncbi:MAG TPA: ABC transporter permease [Fimbriimonadaceae bacterium]|nr:ABC transporter permease [Fimbriimonadaceae bacterium]